MFRRIFIGTCRHFFTIVAQDDFRIIAPRGGGIVTIQFGQIRNQFRDDVHHLYRQRFVISDQPNRRIITVFGLRHQIRCNDKRVCGLIGQDQTIGWTSNHIDANAPKKNAFGFSYKLISWTYKDICLWQPEQTKSHRSDPLDPPHRHDFVSAT